MSCVVVNCHELNYLRAGFTGGLVVDYPNSTKAKKYYLCLSFEHGYKTPAPKVAEQPGGAATAKFDVSFLVVRRKNRRAWTRISRRPVYAYMHGLRIINNPFYSTTVRLC